MYDYNSQNQVSRQLVLANAFRDFLSMAVKYVSVYILIFKKKPCPIILIIEKISFVHHVFNTLNVKIHMMRIK